LKKEGLGRWTNLLIGMAGAVIGGELAVSSPSGKPAAMPMA
jgi:hypothetical protein